ncbi:hypothetical protein [Neopusillimonas aromaticivorans]|uniref:hypothetical protein n=1 Tax=Neopusillimonas aromaticivorans TaxID=2979868 RepID=UPI00259899A8|nr:hypothetical protein [Neopusillimonas aromaticivorans]WJJ93983.1 hypothetical protein N7E01_02035 [Neopusillimonas aromaticivorans]
MMLKAIWGKVWPYLAAIGAAFAAVLAIRQSGKAAGRQETRQEINEAISTQRSKINEADTHTSQMDDRDVRRELRKWVRPDAEGD